MGESQPILSGPAVRMSPNPNFPALIRGADLPGMMRGCAATSARATVAHPLHTPTGVRARIVFSQPHLLHSLQPIPKHGMCDDTIYLLSHTHFANLAVKIIPTRRLRISCTQKNLTGTQHATLPRVFAPTRKDAAEGRCRRQPTERRNGRETLIMEF